MVRVFALFLVLALALLAGLVSAPSNDPAKLIQQDGLVLFPRPLPVAPFQFVDEHGDAIDQQQLQGRWQVLFFGYTYCPDICPMTLTHLNRSWKKLTPVQQQQLGVVMVSVDPQRDTPQSLQSYMEYFNPAFRAMTGNPQSLQRLATQLHAVYNRVERPDGQAYLMDHSANLVVLDPKGRYRGYIAPPHAPERLVPVLTALLDGAAG
ncbi:cytochrome c oxidase assembly protein [Bacterioplanes sanyensis]|uniref:SCO family protein n=1 Tax=Bacterioplanes sanyensis TaxID=1249553 RepID=UPI001678D33A|nr:SCO family protein [Bacterioplanes sanyensis]GGY49395.1 cytochrome c oxidase assembly protein [Bacterioplanes sanyensis]